MTRSNLIIMSEERTQVNPMGVNAPPTAYDFVGDGKGLNMAGFTNFEKSFISEALFRGEYGDRTKYEVTTRAALIKRQTELADMVEKGESTWEDHKNVFKGFNRVVVRLETGRMSEVFVKAIEPSDDDIQKAESGDLIKSLISYDTKINFSKSGKEIKEKLGGLKGKIMERITTIATEMADLVNKIGFQPDRDCESYYYRNTNVPQNHKMYSWDIRRESRENSAVDAAQDVSALCDNYNEKVRCLIDCKCDLAEADFFINNLVDGKSYTLTASEAMKLGF